MSLGTFVGGPYVTAYGSGPTSIGLTEDGIRYRQAIHKAAVRADAYGDSVIDEFYRGGDVHLTLVGLEYGAGLKALLYPFSPTPGQIGKMGLVGRSVESQIASAIVLSAIAGTPAATNPASLTAAKACIEGEVDFELAARLRRIPVTMRCYPYTSNSETVWCVVT